MTPKEYPNFHILSYSIFEYDFHVYQMYADYYSSYHINDNFAIGIALSKGVFCFLFSVQFIP